MIGMLEETQMVWVKLVDKLAHGEQLDRTAEIQRHLEDLTMEGLVTTREIVTMEDLEIMEDQVEATQILEADIKARDMTMKVIQSPTLITNTMRMAEDHLTAGEILQETNLNLTIKKTVGTVEEQTSMTTVSLKKTITVH